MITSDCDLVLPQKVLTMLRGAKHVGPPYLSVPPSGELPACDLWMRNSLSNNVLYDFSQLSGTPKDFSLPRRAIAMLHQFIHLR